MEEGGNQMTCKAKEIKQLMKLDCFIMTQQADLQNDVCCYEVLKNFQ